MTDRLPEPRALALQPTAAERASATPRAVSEPAREQRSLRPAQRTPRTLAELQDWMVAAICETDERESAGIVTAGPRLSSRDCLAIYRHGYVARLRECLRDDYPVLAASIGDESFDALCRHYIAEHPSQTPSLNAFGRFMPEVCLTSSLLEQPAFCADLARLEWALVEVTHAPASEALDLQALQAIPPDAWAEARLISHRALRLLRFDYPVNAHYQAYRGDDVLRPIPAASASATAVYRRGQALWRMDLTPAMTRVLGALLDGSSIGAALALINLPELDAASQAEAERSVMVWFQAWMSSGFFSEVRVSA